MCPDGKKGEAGLVTQAWGVLCPAGSTAWKPGGVCQQNWNPLEVQIHFTWEGYVWFVKGMSIIFFFSN